MKINTLRKIALLIATVLGLTLVGVQPAQAIGCDGMGRVYNPSNSGSAIRVNGWWQECQNYTFDLPQGQNTWGYTNPTAAFDPEWFWTSFCYAIYYELRSNGVYKGRYTATWPAHHDGWTAVPDHHEVFVIAVNRVVKPGC